MAIVFNGSESHLACGLLISSGRTWGGYFCRETAWRPSARCHRHDQCSSIACRDNSSSSSTQHRWCHRVRHIDYNYYFANAAVTVDSSHIYDDAVNASSSASWSRFSPSSNLVNEHQSTMWFMVCHWPQSQWFGETPFVQGSTTLALTCLETVHQRSCMTRETDTWLSDSRVGNNSVVDHGSQWPVLSPLCNCVDRCHFWSYWASRCKP